MDKIRIAVDAMGGDHAPQVVIEGVIQYIKEYRNHTNTKIVLVGKEREIKKILGKLADEETRQRIEVLNALENISMKEHFLSYWRKREKTSIKKALDLITKGKAHGMVSAGNTGAVMSIGKSVLGPLENVERPALAIMIPTVKGNSLLLDVGANVDSKPKNLVQSALMAKVFLENVYGKTNPKIGLMSVGEEEVKGNELTKKTYNLLKSLDVNFIGNVEGRDAYLGKADIIVTDGFTGNVTLKVTEGVIEVMVSMLKREIMTSLLSKIGFFFLKSSFRRLKKKLDYAETGGALLLGINGIVIIGHGGSNAKAIMNAVKLARNFVEENVLEKISLEVNKI